MTRHLGAHLVVVSLLLLAACGTTSGSATDAPELDRPATFAARAITWAQGTTVHYGAQTFAVPGDVDDLWRSPYGFLVSVHPHGTTDTASEVVFFDGKDTTPVKGDPRDIRLSPDGRYAGWIDFDGPKRPLGRLAEVVVTDLRTGRELFRDRKDMGSTKDDLTDLYEDAEVHFLGFDDDYVYWDTPTGEPRLKRARIGSWKVEPAGRTGTMGDEQLDGEPYDELVGHRTAMAADGRVSPDGTGFVGFRSPEGRWCLTNGETGHLSVVDCRTGRKATPRYPATWAFFGGWQDADTFYVLSRRHYDYQSRPPGEDHSTGVLASCDLPSGKCRTVRPLTRTDSVVWATGSMGSFL